MNVKINDTVAVAKKFEFGAPARGTVLDIRESQGTTYVEFRDKATGSRVIRPVSQIDVIESAPEAETKTAPVKVASARPNVVSGFLVRSGFARSLPENARLRSGQEWSSGFTASAREGVTYVTHVIGSDWRDADTVQRNEMIASEILHMERALSDHYTVARAGAGSSLRLVVRPKH